ncbi:DUF2336 domain-containing protein [Bosea sp. PAMC 26642]|uniref:DUF2336 domain-containing protein n=1 Tax=Bosea sp. (strain PAMC 26642) TaxID=1792307 RepID=UPI0007703B96|nr:DUF2336 domain-containing protein [Bosea sp. PAMC 26642]AMJ59519.1 hypothetical protein AXW83_03650 [Bosea sp. PAMC 26642]
MLHSLTRMPADMSPDSRRQLLNAVTDLFLLDDDPTVLAKEHYGEIAVHSLSRLEADDRKSYADQVAAVPSLPHEVATTLASDADADVARLVLKLSPVLTDIDLAAIAVSQSQRHLVAIAERVQLSESLTEILVERGDNNVLQTVSSNEGALFSDTGFDRLLQRGGDDAAVASALAGRSDLTPGRAQRVLRIVEQMGDGAVPPNSRITDAQALARQARQQRLEVKLLLSDLAARTRELDDVLIMLAEEDRAYHLAQVLAQAVDITTERALRVLMQRDASGIAVACKSLGVGMDAFRAVMALRERRLLFSSNDMEDALKSYAKLDAAFADRTLRFLKVKTKLG